MRGTVAVIDTDGTVLPDPFVNLRDEVNAAGDRGMLGIALDPDFMNNRHIYLLYTVDPDEVEPDEPSTADTIGRLVRYTGTVESGGNVADLASRLGLIGVPASDGIPVCDTSHTIGSVRFGNDGSLFVGAGDGGHFNIVDSGGNDPGCLDGVGIDQDVGAFRSQYLGSMAGKILRIDPATGLGLPDNPHWTGNGADIRSRVWMSGLRNPFRFRIRPGSPGPGTLYIGDVGWSDFEELNAGYGGENFGWPCYEGPDPAPLGYPEAEPKHSGCDTIETPENPGPLTFPLLWWHHSDTKQSFPPDSLGWSSNGGVWHEGTSYPYPFRRGLFVNDHIWGWFRVVELDDQDQFVAIHRFNHNDVSERITELVFNPIDGWIYYTSVVESKIKRIKYIAEQVQPTSFTVIGRLRSGSVEDIEESDDSRVFIEQRPSFTPFFPAVRIDVTGNATTDVFASLVTTFEASCNAIPGGVLQRISMFDYQAGTWELMDGRTATQLDSVAQFTIDTDPQRFVQTATFEVKSRMEWFDPGNLVFPAWGGKIDEVAWDLIP
jgi:glucose/arabinose dehydrogenase